MTEKTRDLSYMALMTALLVLCAWLVLPLGPVTFTLQTFGVFAALGILGGKRGTVTVLVYLALGLVGLPVFSGFSGGPAGFMTPTGGYLLGFLAAALVYWALTAKGLPQAPAMGLGLLACYTLGTGWFFLLYGDLYGGDLWSILTLCVFPYILPDLLKLSLALVVSRRMSRAIPR
ncbi:MAG: biotin transporter BioY [Ruminiclostridium sp.]|nr:biotin transporter BioY [Ruminiclostridium sp.]